MFTVDYIKWKIIHRLTKWNKWGGSHTEHILQGFPKHLLGTKCVKDALKELIQDAWVLPTKKTGEIHYSLNPRKSNEIAQFYEAYLQNQDV